MPFFRSKGRTSKAAHMFAKNFQEIASKPPENSKHYPWMFRPTKVLLYRRYNAKSVYNSNVIVYFLIFTS